MQSNIPLFSILMPTHNRADVIGYAIQSVLHQTFSNFELLIVGDGCTDNTEKVVSSFVKKDKRVNWFPFPKAPGFGYALRNPVLKKAKGKYIAFAAHDDLWFPDHLEKFVQFFGTHPKCEFAYSRPLWIHPDGTFLPSTFNLLIPEARKVFFESHNEIPADCVVHTASSMKKVGYWNVELPSAADWDLWKRILLSSPKQLIGFLPEPTSIHFRANWRAEDNSSTDTLKLLYEWLSHSKEFDTKIEINNKHPLQQTVWGKLKKEIWMEELRSQVDTIIEVLAYRAGVVELKNKQLEKKLAWLHRNPIYKTFQILKHSIFS
jgi:glycosyltransferase involved in cell wall biosynthesis